MVRQFFKNGHDFVRIMSPLAYVVTDTNPIQPYANEKGGEKTKDIRWPHIDPLSCLSYFFEDHIYRDINSFPVKSESALKPQIHTCIEMNHSINRNGRIDSDYHGRSLIMAFASALAQARLNYGPDVSGVLPQPITVHFVNGNGIKFHFSVFQLNTLDLDGKDKVKNIFWHQAEMDHLYTDCSYALSQPTLTGYNHAVFNKLLAMYLLNAD